MTTTSGSYDFKCTAGDIITAACEDLGVVQPGQTVPAAIVTMALNRLNMIAKTLQGTNFGEQGVQVFSRKRITMMMEYGRQTYTIGPASTDARASLLVGRTTISADEASGQTVLSITSNTDTTSYPGTTITMTAADIIGIELNNGTIDWRVISGTPSTTATVTVAISGAASAGRYVWWFTSRAQRFPVLEAAKLRDASRNDSPLYVYRTVQDYELGVSNKYQTGDPNNILVEPGLINTKITLDSQPTATTIQKTIELTVLYPAEDYDAVTDDIAFPQESIQRIKWELMLELANPTGKTWTPAMEKGYARAVAIANQLNPEVSDAYFRPNAW